MTNPIHTDSHSKYYILLAYWFRGHWGKFEYVKAFAILKTQLMCVRQVWYQKSVQCAVAWTQTLWPQASVQDPLLFDFQTGGYEGESEMMSNRTYQFVFHHRLHQHIKRCAWLCLRALHHELDLSTALDRASSWGETLESKVKALLKQTASIAHHSRWTCTTSRKSELKRRVDLGATGTLWKRTVSKRANSICPM